MVKGVGPESRASARRACRRHLRWVCLRSKSVKINILVYFINIDVNTVFVVVEIVRCGSSAAYHHMYGKVKSQRQQRRSERECPHRRLSDRLPLWVLDSSSSGRHANPDRGSPSSATVGGMHQYSREHRRGAQFPLFGLDKGAAGNLPDAVALDTN